MSKREKTPVEHKADEHRAFHTLEESLTRYRVRRGQGANLEELNRLVGCVQRDAEQLKRKVNYAFFELNVEEPFAYVHEPSGKRESDNGGCPQPGSGGFHSDGYGDGDSCAWCGARKSIVEIDGRAQMREAFRSQLLAGEWYTEAKPEEKKRPLGSATRAAGDAGTGSSARESERVTYRVLWYCDSRAAMWLRDTGVGGKIVEVDDPRELQPYLRDLRKRYPHDSFTVESSPFDERIGSDFVAVDFETNIGAPRALTKRPCAGCMLMSSIHTCADDYVTRADELRRQAGFSTPDEAREAVGPDAGRIEPGERVTFTVAPTGKRVLCTFCSEDVGELVQGKPLAISHRCEKRPAHAHPTWIVQAPNYAYSFSTGSEDATVLESAEGCLRVKYDEPLQREGFMRVPESLLETRTPEQIANEIAAGAARLREHVKAKISAGPEATHTWDSLGAHSGFNEVAKYRYRIRIVAKDGVACDEWLCDSGLRGAPLEFLNEGRASTYVVAAQEQNTAWRFAVVRVRFDPSRPHTLIE